MPYVDHIIDARQCEDGALVGESWPQLWGDYHELLGGKRRI
jgi:hypothetical protein